METVALPLRLTYGGLISIPLDDDGDRVGVWLRVGEYVEPPDAHPKIVGLLLVAGAEV